MCGFFLKVSKSIATLWSINQDYNIGDVVMHKGVRYVALEETVKGEGFHPEKWKVESIQEVLASGGGGGGGGTQVVFARSYVSGKEYEKYSLVEKEGKVYQALEDTGTEWNDEQWKGVLICDVIEENSKKIAASSEAESAKYLSGSEHRVDSEGKMYPAIGNYWVAFTTTGDRTWGKYLGKSGNRYTWDCNSAGWQSLTYDADTGLVSWAGIYGGSGYADKNLDPAKDTIVIREYTDSGRTATHYSIGYSETADAQLLRGTIEGKFTDEQKEELAETFAKKEDIDGIVPSRVKNDDDTERIDGSGNVYTPTLVVGGYFTASYTSSGVTYNKVRFSWSSYNSFYYYHVYRSPAGHEIRYTPSSGKLYINGTTYTVESGVNPKTAGAVIPIPDSLPSTFTYLSFTPQGNDYPLTASDRFARASEMPDVSNFATKEEIPITVNDINAYGLGRYIGVLASPENPMTLYKDDIVVIRSQEWPGHSASSYGVFRFIYDTPMKIESGSQLPDSSPLAWEEVNASESGLANITNLAKDFGYSIKGALETDSHDPYQIGMTHFLLRDHEIGYIDATPENLEGSELVLVLDHEHDGTRFDSVYRIRTRTAGTDKFDIWICCKDWNGSFEINRDSWILEEGRQYLLGITYFGGDVYTVCITEVYV